MIDLRSGNLLDGNEKDDWSESEAQEAIDSTLFKQVVEEEEEGSLLLGEMEHRKARIVSSESEKSMEEGFLKNDFAKDRDEQELDSDSDDERRKKAVGLWTMVMIVFFTVGGGPIGSEEVISAGGPTLGMLAMVVFPWIYCFPVSLISAELATVFPEDGSFTLWVADCFGDFWAFQDGYWSWVSGVLDNAMYPALATELILGVGEARTFKGVWVVNALAILASVLNFMGVRIVGRAMIVLGVVVMSPYFLMVFMWLFKFLSGAENRDTASVDSLKSSSEDHVSWKPNYIELLHSVYWSYSGWDSVSTFAGEVSNPRKTFPLALFISVVAVCTSYLAPLFVGLSEKSSPHWSTWKEGSFHEIGLAVGGKSLAFLLGVSSSLSLLAMYCAEMFIDSFLLLGMAEQGLIPKVFAKRDRRHNTPYVALILSLVVMCTVTHFLNFTTLMQVNNCLTCLSVLIELVAGIKIRFRHSAEGRKVGHNEFRAPFSNWAILAFLFPAILVVIGIVLSTFVMATRLVQMTVTLLLLSGGLFYVLLSRRFHVPRKD